MNVAQTFELEYSEAGDTITTSAFQLLQWKHALKLEKLANQIMVAVNISGVAQALLLASAGGAEPAQIPEALSGHRAF